MKMKIAFALIMFCYCVIIAKADDPTVNVEKDKIEYAKGSVCGYCDYCKVWIFLDVEP